MAYSKLQELIEAFSLVEKDAFLKYLESPYFVKGDGPEMIRYFNMLVEGKISYSDKETLHKGIYPDKPFSADRLERVNTRLIQLIEHFFITEYYHRDTNTHQQMLDLARVFREKKMKTAYEKQVTKLNTAVKDKPKESSKLFLEKLLNAQESHAWESTYNTGKTDLSISEVLTALNLFYYSEQLEMRNRYYLQQFLGTPPTAEVVKVLETLPVLPAYFEQKSPLLALKKQILNIFTSTEPTRQAFEQLLSNLQENEQILSHKTNADLFAFVRSCCSYLITAGHHDLYEILHLIQKDNLRKGYFHENNRIIGNTLISITRNALAVGQIQWAREVIDHNRGRIITESEQEEVYQLLLALCLFEEKKFEEALRYIQYTFQTITFFFIARRLELRIYYELQSDLLPYKMEAFRKHLERTKIRKASEYEWENNRNFLLFLQQLNPGTPHTAKSIQRILDRMAPMVMVGERRWFLEKFTALLKTK